MPRVSEFYGIAIYFYYADHNPPHFHAIYAGEQAEVAIRTGEILNGSLPPGRSVSSASGTSRTEKSFWSTGTALARVNR